MSLNSIADKGSAYARRRLGRNAPPNNAMAPMGVMLGACGMRRAMAATTTMPVNTINRLFIADLGAVSLLHGRNGFREIRLRNCPSDRQQIGIVPSVAHDDFTHLNSNGAAENGAVIDE